jgi:hypothetical protein
MWCDWPPVIGINATCYWMYRLNPVVQRLWKNPYKPNRLWKTPAYATTMARKRCDGHKSPVEKPVENPGKNVPPPATLPINPKTVLIRIRINANL